MLRHFIFAIFICLLLFLIVGMTHHFPIIFYPAYLGGRTLNRWTLYMILWGALGLFTGCVLLLMSAEGHILILGIPAACFCIYYCGVATYVCYKRWTEGWI